MKTHNQLVGAAIICMVAGSIALGAESKPTTPYNPEQSKGDLRVVLVRVDRTTTFSKEGFTNPDNTETHAIPGLTVVYLVEALGRGPVPKWAHQDSAIYVGGKRLSEVAENLSSGGSSGLLVYGSHGWAGPAQKPKVRGEKKTVIHQEWHRGVRVPNRKMDLHITVGADNKEEKFVFTDIPVE
ncbi:MAG TPA: hypothetical protein VGF13_01010 [Verrucomicrobiae bacterium]|jgi:hypothetical protein